jgi:type IV secretory pathway VirB2 component (pilin)
MERRLRGEVLAIAVAAFAVLSLVALLTDQGAVLQWWRGLLVGAFGAGSALVPPALAVAATTFWWPALRSRLIMPVAGATITAVALLSIAEIAFADPASTGPGGGLGRAVGRGLEGLLGTWGSVVALLAVFVVGVVVAAERGLAEMLSPVVQRRPQFALRSGTALPSGTAAPSRRERGPAVQGDDDDAPQLRINLPEERPAPVAVEERKRPAPVVPPAVERTERMPVADGARASRAGLAARGPRLGGGRR